MTLVLDRAALEGLVPVASGIDAVEDIFRDLGDGSMSQPAPVALASPRDDAVFLPMTARSDRLGLAVVKMMSDIPANADRGLPTQRSTLLVMSAETGACRAVLDGGPITRQRTAATSAVATRHLARHDARVLGLIGAGALAVEHVIALATVRAIERVVVWSRTDATASTFEERLRARGSSLPVLRAADPEAVVAASDIVCTLTPSREPILRGEWLRPGQHVNAVGAPPRATHREVDTAAMVRARLVVDSEATARAKSGDLLLAEAEGGLDPEASLLELGSVVAGRAAGRRDAHEITLFDSVGLAAQDLALAACVLEASPAFAEAVPV